MQFLDYGSWLLQICHKLEKWQRCHNLSIWRHCQFFDVALFLLSSLVTGPSFMSVSSLELWPFTFIRDWSEIRKSKTPPSKFCPISRDCGKLGIPNLAGMFLMKCYKMSYSFSCFRVIKGKPTGGGGGLPPIQIRV